MASLNTQAVVSLMPRTSPASDPNTQPGTFFSPAGQRTDDQGNFRLTGLPAGEYLLRTNLELSGAYINSPGTDLPHDPDYRWDIYLGDGVRPRDAKTIKLKDGEESNATSSRYASPDSTPSPAPSSTSKPSPHQSR